MEGAHVKEVRHMQPVLCVGHPRMRHARSGNGSKYISLALTVLLCQLKHLADVEARSAAVVAGGDPHPAPQQLPRRGHATE
jgi:hypothetical protein